MRDRNSPLQAPARRLAARCVPSGIDLPPNGDCNHPTKLDHFVFLRKKKSANRLRWEADPEITRHYGEQCRELHIMLIDDDIENVFPREEATYFDREEKRKKTSSIWALSLEVEGDDMRKLIANLTENARLFAETRKLLGSSGKVSEVVEDEQEQAPRSRLVLSGIGEWLFACGRRSSRFVFRYNPYCCRATADD